MIKKIIIAVVILLVLLVIGVQLFLQHGLTDVMRRYVLPEAREKLKVDVSLEKVSVNLLAGSFSVYGVQVASPPGFQEADIMLLKRFNVGIGIPTLLKGGIIKIRKAVVKNGIITIARNNEGRLNIEPLLGARGQQPPGTGVSAPASPPPPASGKKDVMIKSMDVKSLIRYVDHQLAVSNNSESAEEPFRMGLNIRAKLKDVANYGNEEVLSGSVNLRGTLMVQDQECAFDVKGRLAPIVDPMRLSFDVSGSIQEVDIRDFNVLTREHGIESGFVCGTATLLCKKGVFDSDKSILRLTFKQIRLTEEKRAQIPGGRLPESLKLVIPVQGTLENPEIDFDEMLKKTLLSPNMFESVLKGMLQDHGKTREKDQSDADSPFKKAAKAPKKKLNNLDKAVKDIFGR